MPKQILEKMEQDSQNSNPRKCPTETIEQETSKKARNL